jgi:hypothetical protein
VRVNTVSPGSILVAGNGWDRYRIARPDYFDDYVRHGFPMGRLGTAEEVADVIVFLLAASPLDQWPPHRGRRVGATARAARSPALLARAGPRPSAGTARRTQVSAVAWQPMHRCGRDECTKAPERMKMAASMPAVASAPVPQDRSREAPK